MPAGEEVTLPWPSPVLAIDRASVGGGGVGLKVAAGIAIALNAGGTEEITTDHIILATGAAAWNPPGWSLDGERVIGSKEALDLSHQPKRVAILGGGVIGCEFACFFAAIGTQTTVIEMLPRLVMAEDEEISAALEREMKKQKIALHLGTKVEDRRDNPDGSITLTLSGGKTVDVDTVLVATGRRPYSAELGLETVGVAHAERGKIVVNDRLQTSVPNIYAIGDVTDIKQLAHFASAQGKSAAEIIADLPDVDVFMAGQGTGGTLIGNGRRLKEHNPNLKVIAVVPHPGDLVQGLRSMDEGFIPPIFDPNMLDGKIMVASKEAFAMTSILMDREGIFAGISSGSVVYAAIRQAQRMERGNIVCLLADGGWKYLSTGLWSDKSVGLQEGLDNKIWW